MSTTPSGTRTPRRHLPRLTATLAFAAAAPYAALLTALSLAASGLLFAFAGRSALAGHAPAGTPPDAN